MSELVKIDAALVERLACPRCGASLRLERGTACCAGGDCGRRYPIVDGVPVLIAEETSLFSPEDFLGGAQTTFDWERQRRRSEGHLLERAAHFLADRSPPLSLLVSDLRPQQALAAICAAIPDAQILVIGCGDELYSVPPPAKIVYSDVSLGPLAQIVLDANDIPFRDQSFDAVIAVAVLAYATDPVRCAAEIRRVLRPAGFVYDTFAFMQQIAMGKYDFTRLTYLGHRRLFRGFTELQHGISNGPAMALAWTLSYFFASFTDNLQARKAIRLLVRYLFFWIKYIDRYLIKKQGAYDCASGFYFFGRKAPSELSDREILKAHRGLHPR